ncbi:adenylyl cyclase [Cellulomonas fengjieae]|uniref:adenylyl cyclase n=1 Tax=Cellulomonas fengjieae TaxID=2819978 RepID=UPI001AAE2149|nr:adenylyl cyclase [Cellulomonas fengjieae]MBO3102532.1 adenylyl cyclase [Cellulomonas fengjieae]
MLPRRHRSTHRRRRTATVLAAALTVALVPLVAAPAQAGPAQAAAVDLGPNTIVFDPSQPIEQIQATVDAIATQQVPAHFGADRYALLFKPGTYGTPEQPLRFEVGYFTEVAGLGQDPGDVVINGAIEVYNQCLPVPEGADPNCIALVNFWRSLSNLTIQYAPGDADGCRSSANFWAVSQAAPMRRVNVTGANLSLMDYCTAGPQYASGGFIADSTLPFVTSGSQQQFLVRNGSVGGWSNSVWNQVFAGVQGAPATDFSPVVGEPKYTTLDTTPVSKEKPYLYVDDAGRYSVFVPSAQKNSAGATWAAGSTPGRSIPLSRFFVAKPGDSAAKINGALALGKNVLFTPGVYHVNRTLTVPWPNQVVLGLGLATIIPDNGVVAMQTFDVPGIDIAGIMFDAGPVNSPALLQLGTKVSSLDARLKRPLLSSAGNPTAVQDVFFRIGGEAVGKATQSLVVNTNQTLIDHTWAWRADHGTGVGWDLNTAETGVLVNGNDVTATGLFAEHYQKYNVIWNGERGRTVMFQNELPYDPPDQASWQHDGVNGWAAYKVGDKVKVHEAWGMGAYIYTNVNPTLHATRAFEVPVTPGVRLHNVLTVSLNAAGTIDHVVNDTGDPVTPTFAGPSTVLEWPVP